MPAYIACMNMRGCFAERQWGGEEGKRGNMEWREGIGDNTPEINFCIAYSLAIH